MRDKKKEYSTSQSRTYEHPDFQFIQYLELNPPSLISKLGINNGRPQLPGLNLDPERVGVADMLGSGIIVPERTKLELEKHALAGLVFAETEILANDGEDVDTGYRRKTPYDGEPWFVLESTVELPPVSPSMSLQDARNNPVEAGSQQNGVRFVEPPYNHAEIHYRHEDAERFPEFDLARTWERFHSPRLIASKRFYEACRGLDLDMGWVPVRIDEE